MATKNPRKWQPLKVGDTVDVVAPGFATTQEALEGAIAFLEKVGLRPRIPGDLFGEDVVCSQSDDIRLKHLIKAFNSKDSQAIWCLRGGYGALRIIEKFSKMKRPPKNKLFIGYSDCTTIHNHMNLFWGCTSLHGPLLDRLGLHNLPLDQVNEVMDLVFGRLDRVTFQNLKPLNKMASTRKTIRAPLVGGNLKVIESTLGTKFCRIPKGKIVFFEEIGERGYRVDRMLKHLQMANYFRGVRAILFGDFIGGLEPDGTSNVQGVLERFANEIKVPVFSGVEVGHGDFQRPLPLGSMSELQCGATGTLKVSAGANL